MLAGDRFTAASENAAFSLAFRLPATSPGPSLLSRLGAGGALRVRRARSDARRSRRLLSSWSFLSPRGGLGVLGVRPLLGDLSAVSALLGDLQCDPELLWMLRDPPRRLELPYYLFEGRAVVCARELPGPPFRFTSDEVFRRLRRRSATLPGARPASASSSRSARPRTLARGRSLIGLAPRLLDRFAFCAFRSTGAARSAAAVTSPPPRLAHRVPPNCLRMARRGRPTTDARARSNPDPLCGKRAPRSPRSPTPPISTPVPPHDAPA